MTARATARREGRGDPDETRKKLVEAAAETFEKDGYFGTDTNKIARAAGYAPATFYKHFRDKREVFLAVYEAWVAVEWRGVAEILERREGRKRTARALVDLLVEHHRRWRGFRASLRALVALDPDVRAFHRRARAGQIATLATLTAGRHDAKEGGFLLLLVERVCDAIADDELASLSLTEDEARAHLAARIAEALRS